MTDSNELNTFDNKAYVKSDEAADGNGNQVKEKNSSNYGGDKESLKENRFANLNPEEIRIVKKGIYKNVIIIAIAFMLLFTAFQSMANLQSSINKVEGLGTTSLAVIYAALVVSCMFVPTLMIKKLTVKWTMVVSIFCYSTYIAAQFYPQFYTLVPGAIILGLGAAPMWSAKCTYLTQVGNIYAELTNQAVEPIIVKFFGIFFLFFQSSSIWGNLISSAVLGMTSDDNVTAVISEPDLSKCGVNYCPAVPVDNSGVNTTEIVSKAEDNFSTSSTQLYILAGVYLACSILSAVVVAILVDPLSKYGEADREEKKEKRSGIQLLVATFKHMKKPYQLLIIPLTFWSGVEQGFFGADFTAGYVSCAWGVSNVGYVLITYGVVDAICSATFGNFIQYVGRVPIFLGGAFLNIICLVILWTWTPNPDQSYVFFFIAALWGAGDAVWQTQINALYGVLFESDEEAAFSNYRLWESLGFIFAYVLQTQVCVFSKLWAVLIVLGCGMVGYLYIELQEWRKSRQPSPE